jgi:hypothetical protein
MRHQLINVPSVGTAVRVVKSIPYTSLRPGDVGVVCSLWYLPHTTIEAEFILEELGETIRVLLSLSDIFDSDSYEETNEPSELICA